MTDRPSAPADRGDGRRGRGPDQLGRRGDPARAAGGGAARRAPEVEAALAEHPRVETLVDPDDAEAQRVATWSGMRREGVMRGLLVDGVPADRIVYARLATDTPVQRAGRVPGAAQLLPAAQAGDQPAAGPRPRRPGAAVPAHLQAGLGPARRGRRGRASPRSGPSAARSRRSWAWRITRGPAAAHRLAAAVGRLGRRALPGLRRRVPRPRAARPGGPAGPRDPRRGVLHPEEVARALRRLHGPPGGGRGRRPSADAPAYVESGRHFLD